MAVVTIQQSVAALYVAVFNRAPDAAGLNAWTAVITSGQQTFAQVAAGFAAHEVFTAGIGTLSNTDFVAALYQNILGSAGDAGGIANWSNQLNAGMSKADVAALFVQAALTVDIPAMLAAGSLTAAEAAAATVRQQTLTNKADVGIYFANTLGAASNLNPNTVSSSKAGLEADPIYNASKAAIANVTDSPASVAAAKDAIAVAAGSSNPAQALLGGTFTLTTGADAFVGGASADVFNALTVKADGADATTLSAFDSIDGGAGKDTLNIYSNGVQNAGLNGATVKNVETININNSDSATAHAGFGAVDASKFVGATAINQVNIANAVTGLAAGTTAGFNGTASSVVAALDVTAAAAATSVSVNLTNAKGVDAGADQAFQAGDNTVGLKVAGAALDSVTVSGNITQSVASVVPAQAASLDLAVTGSTTATSFSLNTSVDTALTLTGMTAVTSVDAASSVGGVTFNGATQVQTITTGAGKDTVQSAFVTTASKGATISTGAGNDTITVTTTGAGLTSVDAGAGDDIINVTKTAGNKLSILGGEGNDTVVLAGAALATTDVINGGAGTDIISLAGSVIARTDDDFIVLNSLLTGFETLKLSTLEGTNLATGLNVAKLATSYTTIDFATASFVDNVGTQALVANGALTAEAAGYKTAIESAADGGTLAVVYAGSLNITEKATGIVTATAQNVALTVDASKAAVTGTLAGDVKSATVSLVQGVNDKGTVATADDVLFAGKAVVTNNAVLTNLESLTLSGNGAADVTNVNGTKLVNVDASALNSVDVAGKVAAGLTYTSTNALAETIKLGAGTDVVTLGASTYGAVNAKTFDTVQGLNLVKDGAVLAATSDKITVADADGQLTGFQKFTTTQTDLDLALKDAAVFNVGGTAADKLVFALGGDTYVYSDTGTKGTVDSNDVLVKLTGTVDLDALVLSLNAVA